MQAQLLVPLQQNMTFRHGRTDSPTHMWRYFDMIIQPTSEILTLINYQVMCETESPCSQSLSLILFLDYSPSLVFHQKSSAPSATSAHLACGGTEFTVRRRQNTMSHKSPACSSPSPSYSPKPPHFSQPSSSNSRDLTLSFHYSLLHSPAHSHPFNN